MGPTILSSSISPFDVLLSFDSLLQQDGTVRLDAFSSNTARFPSQGKDGMEDPGPVGQGMEGERETKDVSGRTVRSIQHLSRRISPANLEGRGTKQRKKLHPRSCNLNPRKMGSSMGLDPSRRQVPRSDQDVSCAGQGRGPSSRARGRKGPDAVSPPGREAYDVRPLEGIRDHASQALGGPYPPLPPQPPPPPPPPLLPYPLS